MWLGRHESTIEFTEAAMERDATKAGSRLPTVQVQALTLFARAHAALGHTREAARALERAIEEAHRYGLWLFEAQALRDLKLLVLDGMGHVDHASQRLGEALRLLVGPAETLTPLLNGLDAAALMSLPPPDPSYHVVYSPPEATALAAGGETDGAAAALRQELGGLRLKELRKRAKGAGVSEDELENALDSDDPKVTLIDLLVECLTAGSTEDQELRSELEGLRLRELRARAKRVNIDQDEVDDATDSDDPKAAIIELLVRHGPGSESAYDRRHFGTALAAAQPTPAPPSTSAKHVMLSYQWDHQAQVTRAHDMLTRLGVKCWMDISGGMGQDIYESMAEGVSNASAVVCFMSQKYQESDNCKLEAKYAKQCGVEMIPVMVEGDGWRPSGWLGVIMAGALWTRLSDDESQFEENVRQLHDQIQKVVGFGAVLPEGLDATDESAATTNEAKEELERLRDELVSKETSQGSVTPVIADPSQPAAIPAGVPKLPPKFHSTEQIHEITRLVLSTSASDMAMPRVGFWGMGGIGKTVSGAAIVRDADVRQHFHAIIWLPLGQTPVISKLQNLCHMQCTGKSLSPELSSDEKKEALQQAMSGKRVLLCLDDLWEEEHELELNFVDVSAGSKVLISTRMKALLGGGHQLEVGLPSLADSARMLLSAAGVDDLLSSEPHGVREIVDLCGRLPLALGIAGRLASTLGLLGTQDWSDMIGVLKEELRECHSGGAEEGMIRASLRGLKGSKEEQANVRFLLLMFAFVPEDTHCPLEVMLLMFNAAHEGTGTGTTMMHLRKWLRILINRSLVLGTVDRPSVHDLVLDFVVAQRSDSELCDCHRRTVDAFIAARPTDAHGQRNYDATRADDPLVTYVCLEVEHHVKNAAMQNELPTVEWLDNVPQDIIVLSAGRVVGVKQLEEMASRAEDGHDWWLAARYWSIVRQVIRESEFVSERCLDAGDKSLDAMSHLDTSTVEVGTLRLAQASMLAMGGEGLTRNSRERSEMEEIFASPAAAIDPASTCGPRTVLTLTGPMLPGFGEETVLKGCRALDKLNTDLLAAAISHPDPQQRINSALMAQANFMFEQILLVNETKATLWEDRFGQDGELLVRTLGIYDYSTHHHFLNKTFNGDWFVNPQCAPLVLRWGDIFATEELTDISLGILRRSIEEPDQLFEQLSWMWTGPGQWANYLHSTGIEYGRDKVAAIMVDAGLTYRTAEATCDACLVPFVRKRGDRSSAAFFTAESVSWMNQMAWILMSEDPGVTPEEILADLPTVEDVLRGILAVPAAISHCICPAYGHMNLFYAMSAVCEKCGDYPRSLEFVDAALSRDLSRGGTISPISRVMFSILRGRVLASLGRSAEAGTALEATAEEARRYGIRFYEAKTLLELKFVLDKIGHGEHGSRRLGAALRVLKGPAGTLTPLLKGLDAAELMAMAPPDSAYVVHYGAEDSAANSAAVEALRKELQAMRMTVLQRRAADEGVDQAQIDDATDSDQPKLRLISLLLAQHQAAAAAVVPSAGGDDTTALREELQGLKVTALSRRAASEGVHQEQIDEAVDDEQPKESLIALILDRSQDLG